MVVLLIVAVVIFLLPVAVRVQVLVADGVGAGLFFIVLLILVAAVLFVPVSAAILAPADLREQHLVRKSQRGSATAIGDESFVSAIV